MTDQLDLREAITEINRLSGAMDNAITTALEQELLAADKERDYRKFNSVKMAEAILGGNYKTATERDTWVKGEAADIRWERDKAAATSKAMYEANRNYRYQLSSYQTALNLNRAQAELLNYGAQTEA